MGLSRLLMGLLYLYFYIVHAISQVHLTLLYTRLKPVNVDHFGSVQNRPTNTNGQLKESIVAL
jgi:hypothetical protein